MTAPATLSRNAVRRQAWMAERERLTREFGEGEASTAREQTELDAMAKEEGDLRKRADILRFERVRRQRANTNRRATLKDVRARLQQLAHRLGDGFP